VAKDLPTVSIVIPVSANENTVRKCLASIRDQDYPRDDYEVILVGSDRISDVELPDLRVDRINADVSPGAKRNIAAKKARGSIIALCDDDVVVAPQWLRSLVSHFDDPLVAVVGGPNESPTEASLRERCSGYIFSSFLGSAQMSTRYGSKGTSIREADETDLIGCNMAVRKSVLEEFAFPEDIWPNEENIFCHNVKKNGYRLLYDSKAVVWHHRRPVFVPHLQQVFRYGRGRGQMMRVCPDSKRGLFLLPSVFVLSLIGGLLLSLLNPIFLWIYLGALLLYVVTVLVVSTAIAKREGDWKALLFLPAAFFLHHCAYGFGLIWGGVSRRKVRFSK